MSIVSWRRFARLPISIIDIGLGSEDREVIDSVADGDAIFLPPAPTATLPPHIRNAIRAFAFMQKTLVGSQTDGDPVIFLDSDILITHPSFLERLAVVVPGELIASRSAWDADFHWTYSVKSLPYLRAAIGRADFSLDEPICNSGVWASRQDVARKVCGEWHLAFLAAIGRQELAMTIRPGTEIGDQEFLIPACRAQGIAWTSLHGSFNMQVHHNRMPWSWAEPVNTSDFHPMGGHLLEAPQVVRAIHYGCDLDGRPRLQNDMLPHPLIRDWVYRQYDQCRRTLQNKTGMNEKLPTRLA